MILDIDTYESVAKLITEVKEVSGKGVEFIIQPLPSSTLANLKTARGLATHHLIIINEKYVDVRHALASYQLRMILGRCRIKTDEKDLTANENAVSDIFVGAQGKVGEQAARQLANMVVSGAVIQLMSVAPGLMAHRETMNLQSDLSAQHKRALITMGENNLNSLQAPKIPIPEKYLKWNKALIAIENVGLSMMANAPHILVPLKLMGLLPDAERFVAPLINGEYDKLDNRQIIDLSATHIGMKSIHHWVKA